MLKLILLLSPLYATLFWFFVLSFNRLNERAAKLFLGKFMLAAFFLYLSHLLYFLPLPEVYHYIDPIYIALNLSVYPLYYIYILLLTKDHTFVPNKHVRYLYIPISLSLLYLAGVVLMTKEQHIAYLYNKCEGTASSSLLLVYQKYIYWLSRFVFIVQAVVYIVLSHNLLLKRKKTLQEQYANMEEDTVGKIQLLNASLIVILLAGVLLSAIGKEAFLKDDILLILPSFIFSVMLFCIGWLGNQLNSLHIDSFELEQEEVELSIVDTSTDQLELIQSKIQTLFNEGKVYLNKDLTIRDVARLVGSNRSYVSLIINNEFHENFSSFVNSYRVQYAQKIVAKSPQISKQSLAEMSGFGSTISMKRAFEKMQAKEREKIKK